ncbi:hypothetical protein WJX79_010523 [Trebouxia sp. C0005]
MDGLSKTDEVLALLNKRERGEGAKPASAAASDANLGFTDFLPSPAAAVLHKLQRISAQPRSDQPKPVIHTINRTASDALKVVLGEQRPEPRQLRRSTASFRKKLFGHEQQAGFEDNIITQDQSKHNVRVHPLSAFKRYWDLAIVFMVAYTVVVLPVRCAFSWDYYHALDAGHNIFHQLAVDWTLATDLLIDLFFMADIALNFNTGFISDQSLVMGKKLVAQNYLRGWFTLDLVSSFPIDLVLFGKRSDLWRLPRLLKVIRGSAVFDKYSWSALKALSEMVTAGYGKQEPETMIDVWVTMFSLLMGTTMWLILGSIITTLLIHLNAAHSEYTAKMTALSQYMMENNLPQELRQRIRDSYEARWKAEKHFDEDQILNEMPGSLRIEVCMHTCAELIASVPFLEDAEDDFVRYLVTQLHPTVYLRNDMIIRAGELGREMFFIKAGAVQVELDGKPITLLKKGSYFGELSLLRDMRRTASVRVVSETCDLFVLTKADFHEVTKDYPDAWHSMNLVAEHRLRMLHSSPVYKGWSLNQKQQTAPPSLLSIKIEQVLERQDLSGESDDEAGDNPLLQGASTVSGQSRRSSQLGLPVRSRRALSQDEPDHAAAADTWPLHRAQSVMVPKLQQPDLDKPFIELSELESFCEKDVDRQLHLRAPDRVASPESLPSWRDEAQEVHQAHEQEQPGDALDTSYDYGDWADAMQQEQSEDPKQRLLQ